jgi:chemotaxis protein histidine kinase CheA
MDPVALSADDLAFLRESVEDLAESQSSPELTRAVSSFNQLVEDIAERRLDRQELFRRLADIERSLSAGEVDAALESGLRDIADQLEKSPLSRPISEALKEKRLADAEQAMRQLAERLSSGEKVDAAELERLRKALETAASQATGRVERLEAARRALEAERRRLLQKKGAQEAASPEQRAEQENQRRRLERLDRELSDAKRAEQKLSELDRELAKAAQELTRELGKSAQSLEAGAEDMNRMARQKMTDQEKQELKQKLEELRELLRQGGPGREQHLKRLQQFAERARGNKGSSPGEQGGPGGKQGGGSPRLTLGPGGRPIPIPGSGSGPPGNERPGNGGGESGGRDFGSGSGPDARGPATDLAGKTEDVTAAAVDTGQGQASSEVVFGAAERGFTGSRYQKVYTQYRTVAEDVLEQDTIPAGYEFYVRRYFQLIRPREVAP